MRKNRIPLRTMDESDLQECLLDTMDILYSTRFEEKDRRAALADIIIVMKEQLKRSLEGTS